MRRLFVVVTYDIADDRRRARVHKKLKGYGKRVQRSVFECAVTPQQLKKLQAQLDRLLDEREDRVHYYLLCPVCQGRAEALNGSLARPARTLIV